ncbi:MAG: T9SS type A sorting domain-containing protein [Candidatus Zixiibacteriota bacterium]|nr:MAG: T9SS type A sorting domain-containing protein [candidate division Zixibacteria bacterium]
MKLTLKTLFMLALMASIGWAGQTPTLTYDRSCLTISHDFGLIEYELFPSVSVGMKAKLPGRLYYAELRPSESLADIAWQVTGRQLLTTVNQEQVFQDMPTTGTNTISSALSELRSEGQLGEEPIHLVDRITIGEQQWVSILALPVNIDDRGNCWFNRSVCVTVGTRQLLPSDLSLDPGAADVTPFDPSIPLFESPTSAAVYLIVTSSPLLNAADELVRYRNSIGINTTVELIDDILGSYEGRDDSERLRERLKQFHRDGGKYVLLAGDETQLPIRYAYPYSTSSQPAAEVLQICDLYFADLTGDWDSDGDGVWGEKYVDQADFYPELTVGRLPFNSPDEVSHYTEKLIEYETNPGGGDFDYLRRAFFFSSDQMRDYDDGGQHGRIAAVYPDHFDIDTSVGLELNSGADPNPCNASAAELIPVVSTGYGIVNIIAHGDHQAFGVRTALYNEWPKSYFMSQEGGGTHGNAQNLEPNGKASFYYSLACDNGAFDKDQPPFNYPQPNLVQCLLGLADAGAVGFIANSRWGWVGSSYLFHTAFFDSVFAHPGRAAAEALYEIKLALPYYRDQVQGLNYFGDPTLKLYADVPDSLSIKVSEQGANLTVTVSNDKIDVDSCRVILSREGEVLFSGNTGSDGSVNVTCDLEENIIYTIAAIKTGFAVKFVSFQTTIITSAEDEADILPREFSLHQNYPNPFNPSTTVSFDLAVASQVRLIVYNTLGQAVAVLQDGNLVAGRHSVEWDGTDPTGKDVASGVYFCRLECDDFKDVKKMVLLR